MGLLGPCPGLLLGPHKEALSSRCPSPAAERAGRSQPSKTQISGRAVLGGEPGNTFSSGIVFKAANCSQLLFSRPEGREVPPSWKSAFVFPVHLSHLGRVRAGQEPGPGAHLLGCASSAAGMGALLSPLARKMPPVVASGSRLDLDGPGFSFAEETGEFLTGGRHVACLLRTGWTLCKSPATTVRTTKPLSLF